MEAQLWKATWKLTGQKYVLALVNHPKIKVSGKDLDEVLDRFQDLVTDKLHDAVPHFEFVEPLPERSEAGGVPYLHILTGHNCADGITNLEQLFQRPRCSKCKCHHGPRSDEPVRLRDVPDGDLMFTDYLGQIISTRLTGFLNLAALTEIAIHPVIIQGKENPEFLELRSRVSREYVADGNRKAARWGHKCKECLNRTWMYMPYEAPFFEYLSETSLPLPAPAIFPVGRDYRLRLAVDHQTRKAVIRSNEFHNVVSQKVGILGKEQAVPVDSFFAW